MNLEDIHQGMEMWKRLPVRLTPRHWQRTWLDAGLSDDEGEAAEATPEAPDAVG
jgi:hypothetical protein